MRSILTFVAVVTFIVFMHATNLRLPDTPTTVGSFATSAQTIPGSSAQLPVPEASEALVYLPDSLFQTYRGDHNLFVTNHYHVLYVKTDTLYLTTPAGPMASRRVYAGNMIYR
jgi:hypothetical protein